MAGSTSLGVTLNPVGPVKSGPDQLRLIADSIEDLTRELEQTQKDLLAAKRAADAKDSEWRVKMAKLENTLAELQDYRKTWVVMAVYKDGTVAMSRNAYARYATGSNDDELIVRFANKSLPREKETKTGLAPGEEFTKG